MYSGISVRPRVLASAVRLAVLVVVLCTVGFYGQETLAPYADRALGIEYDQMLADASESEFRYVLKKREIRVIAEARLKALMEEYKNDVPLRTIERQSALFHAVENERLIAADLSVMQLYLYEGGKIVETVPIASKGKRGSRWETPTGFYQVQTKEQDHFSSIGEVHMPYSMQFFGNFFIHGWPYYPSGTPVDSEFSGGCVRLSTKDAEKVYAFAEKNTAVFVYDDPPLHQGGVSLSRHSGSPDAITARSFIVADVDSGSVFLERNAGTPRTMASITKLMTALVANESIHYTKTLQITRDDRTGEGDYGTLSSNDTLTVGDAFYPLLMESNNAVAHALARHYGTNSFLTWMNDKARALGMVHTQFADPSGISAQNKATAEDIFRLARYLLEHQSFILGVTRLKAAIATDQKTGEKLSFRNLNHFSGDEHFIGGKTGYTTAAKETMVSIFEVPVGTKTARVAIVVLGSEDREQDTKKLLSWFTKSAEEAESGSVIEMRTI
ncbi:MAG: L,D-transpeptidase family protein [Patescibacteria group bacterium]